VLTPASRLKIGTTLDAAELIAIVAPEGQPRVTLRIRGPGRIMSAEIAAKSLRRAQTAIRVAGPGNTTVILQGALAVGDTIAEAGLSAQPKNPTR
jgi:hypothetical protein